MEKINNMANHEKKTRYKISFNSPVILTFSLLCLVALILNQVTFGKTNLWFFSVYHSSLSSPLTYVRMVGHVFGHANWSHFMGNITLLLVIGPLLEEKYGSKKILLVIFLTALVTGLANYIFFPNYQVLGASGVVFAMILLCSFTSFKNGEIPLTFLLVAIIYIGEQIYDGLFVQDSVSNFSHIIGGAVGAGFGFMMKKEK